MTKKESERQNKLNRMGREAFTEKKDAVKQFYAQMNYMKALYGYVGKVGK